jgi:hypothetical protein
MTEQSGLLMALILKFRLRADAQRKLLCEPSAPPSQPGEVVVFPHMSLMTLRRVAEAMQGDNESPSVPQAS